MLLIHAFALRATLHAHVRAIIIGSLGTDEIRVFHPKLVSALICSRPIGGPHGQLVLNRARQVLFRTLWAVFRLFQTAGKAAQKVLNWSLIIRFVHDCIVC